MCLNNNHGHPMRNSPCFSSVFFSFFLLFFLFNQNQYDAFYLYF